MSEAWMVRGIQRQRLIEDLIRKVYDEEDKRLDKDKIFKREDFLFSFVSLIGGYLSNENEEETASFFLESILPSVKKFSRSDSEAKALLSTLLEKVLSSATQSFHQALHREEFENPQQIFHAPSAMAEVDLDVEDFWF